MDSKKRKALEAAGWQFGDAADFLKMSDEERRQLDARLSAKLSSNLLRGLPSRSAEELTAVLVETPHVRIERIVSFGQASPAGFWYDQDQREWVVLLRGAARLRFKDDEHPLEMRPGDFVDIPAHRRHRVEWTSPDEPTVWMAVHFDD